LNENIDHTDLRKTPIEASDSGFAEVDFNKLIGVLRKSIPLVILILIITNSVAYLLVRYTKPIYQSVSDLKLDIKSEATILGINPTPNFDNLSGEIELIRSKLFFNKVIDAVKMDITYNYYGKILTEERYKNSPFKVNYKLLNSAFYDKKFDLDLINNREFRFSYQWEGKENVNEYNFGQLIRTPHFEFEMNLTPQYDPEISRGKYFFTINSRPALIKYIEKKTWR